jgi:biotin carboxyl carrier protein
LDEQSLVISAPVIDESIIATLIHCISNTSSDASSWNRTDGWSNSGAYYSQYSWLYEGEELNYRAKINESLIEFEKGDLVDIIANAHFYQSTTQLHLTVNHLHYTFDKINHQSAGMSASEGDIISPMPGKVLDIRVAVGDEVKQDQTIVVMEAMKMELSLKATCDATVKSILVQKDDVIAADTILIELEISA